MGRNPANSSLTYVYSIHYLPVVRAASKTLTTKHGTYISPLLLEGLLTSQDIDLAAALSREDNHGGQSRSWQERRVVEVMNPTPLLVRLKQAHIAYQFADLQAEGDAYA